MHWSVKYIRKTSEEVGFCWGLMCLIYQDFGIQIPPVIGLTKDNAVQASKQALQAHQQAWIQVDKPFEGCVVAMGQTNEIHHVGVYTEADGGKVVHCWANLNVIADTFHQLKLRGFKVIKFYRHSLWPAS